MANLNIFTLAVALMVVPNPISFTNSLTEEIREGNSHSTQQSQADILFDTSDIASTYALDNGETVSLQAFKTRRTNQLLSKPLGQLTPSEVRTLRWVTPGVCNVVPETLILRPTHAQAKIACLDSRIQSFLAEKASQQYGLNITGDQILRLVLSRMVCKVAMFDDGGGKITILGAVHSFQRHPLTLDLDAPPGSISRTAVQRAISKNETLDFECDTYANGKLERRNTLKIAFDSSSESEFIEELIGNGEAKFVTRNQLNAFSQELYERLSIEEEYEMPQSIFSDAFVTEFIRFGSAYGFRQEPIKDALQILSQYATDTTQDLSPDTIIRDLGSIFMVENVANERRVVVNKGILDKLRQKYGSSSSGSGSVEASALGLLSSRTSIAASVSQNSKHDRHYQNRSLLDELNKLNSKIANQVSFEIEGNRVIPKTLNVAKMVRTKLSRIFHLRRVRKEQYSAPYFERLHIHYNDQAAVKFKSQMLIVVKQMLDESGAQVKAQCSNLLTEKTNELLVSINENRRIVNDIISYPLNRIRRNEAKIESVITFFRNKTIMTGFHMHYYDDDPEIGPTHKHDDLRQDNIAKFGRWWKRHYLKFQFSVMNATDFL